MGNTVFPFEAVAPATPEERLLLRRYPLFFRAAYFPGTHPSNLGLWGIECGPGWHPLIEQAASIIEADLHKLLRRLTNVQMLTSVERRLQYIRSEEHTSELQSLMRISYAVFCLKKKKQTPQQIIIQTNTKIITNQSHQIDAYTT